MSQSVKVTLLWSSVEFENSDGVALHVKCFCIIMVTKLMTSLKKRSYHAAYVMGPIYVVFNYWIRKDCPYSESQMLCLKITPKS